MKHITMRSVVALHVLALTTVQRARSVRDSAHTDDGLTTLEIVIWGVGLFTAALAAVGIITAAIKSRVSGIS